MGGGEGGSKFLCVKRSVGPQHLAKIVWNISDIKMYKYLKKK